MTEQVVKCIVNGRTELVLIFPTMTVLMPFFFFSGGQVSSVKYLKTQLNFFVVVVSEFWGSLQGAHDLSIMSPRALVNGLS